MKHFIKRILPSIERYESCIGLSFPAIGKYKIELWYCPPHYAIAKHKHPEQDIRLTFLFGAGTTFYRERPTADGSTISSRTVTPREIGRTFNILRSDYHWFTVSKYPLIFLNVEKWYSTPTSVAKDFKLYAGQ